MYEDIYSCCDVGTGGSCLYDVWILYIRVLFGWSIYPIINNILFYISDIFYEWIFSVCFMDILWIFCIFANN